MKKRYSIGLIFLLSLIGNGQNKIDAKWWPRKCGTIYPKAKYKLLFGTDWYLIGSETAKYGKYNSFTKSLIENLALVDPELPAYCMVINPKKFLRIEIIADKLFEVFGKEFDIRELVKITMPNTISTFKTIHKNL